MKKTIIALNIRSGAGKSETIRKVFEHFEQHYPHAIITRMANTVDVLATVETGGYKIGFESQGDPNSRMLKQHTLEKLAKADCHILVCACRTSGATANKVEEISARYGYHIIWKSTNYNFSLANYAVLNHYSAEEIIALIKALYIGQL